MCLCVYYVFMYRDAMIYPLKYLQTVSVYVNMNAAAAAAAAVFE